MSLTCLKYALLLCLVIGCNKIEDHRYQQETVKTEQLYQSVRQTLASGDSLKAAQLFHREISQIMYPDPPYINAAYAKLMWDTGQGDLAFNEIVRFTAQGSGNADSDRILKTIYIENGHGSEQDFVAFADSIAHKAHEETRKRVRTKRTDQALADFMLMDTQGNAVTLSQYRGKVVVLDFWASWCTPCIVSFADMQQIMAMTDSDKVHFLYINTMESAANQSVHARDFMAEHGYEDFHTLIDPDNALSLNYRVSRLPTKMIIGTDGRAKFIKLGHNSDFDVTSRELLTMIELAAE